jgi:hypothetical protein
MENALQKTRAWLKPEKRSVWFEYGALSLIIILPLLLPGYILTLDLVFTPTFSWPHELTNTYPLEGLLWLLHWILPGEIIEKSILFLILLLSGVGAHLLIRRIGSNKEISIESWQMAAYFGGIFYMINPFTYSRFMAGQWMVLLGYSLLSFFLLALLRLMALPTLKAAIKVALWAFVIMTVSLHHIGILGLLGVSIVVTGVIKYWRSSARLRPFLGYAGLSILFTGVLSSFWLIPAMLGQGNIGQAVSGFDQMDFQAFATSGQSTLGAIGDVIRLEGFWAESRGLYFLPQSMLPMWGVVFLIIWIIIIIGAVKAWRRQRTLVLISIGCISLGIILAVTPLLSWLSQFIPFVAGYREPHKFVNLVVIGYAILGAFGVAYIVERATEKFDEIGGQVATIICLLLVLAATPTMLWGFAGQLSPRTYPSEWSAMNTALKDKVNGERVLFLPWHQYQKYSFSGRIIANPAEKFFEVPMVISDEPEFKDIQPTIPNQEKRDISSALKQPDDLARVLKDHTVRYILLAKEEGEDDYGYLDRADSIRLISEDTRFKLYEVKNE